MKFKHLKIFAGTLLALFFAVSCGEDGILQFPQINVDTKTVTIPAEGGYGNSVNLDIPLAWSVEIGASWVGVSPSSGAAGKFTLEFYAEPNNTGETRECKAIISATGLQAVSINIVQTSMEVNPDPPTPQSDHEWSVIGTIQGHNWDYDIPMVQCYEKGGYYALINYNQGEEFKLRYHDNWGTNRGITDGYGLGGHTGVQDGPNIYLYDTGLYEVFYYPADELIYIEYLGNLASCSWGLTGSTMNLGWANDIPVSSYNWDGDQNPVVYFFIDYYPGEEFKIRFQHEWFLNFGMDNNYGVVPMVSGREYAIAQDGPNMSIDEPVSGKYMVGFNLYKRIVRVDRMGDINNGDSNLEDPTQGDQWDW